MIFEASRRSACPQADSQTVDSQTVVRFDLQKQVNHKATKAQNSFLLSIVRSFIVAFRSAKEWKNATFAERNATLVFRTMLSVLVVTIPVQSTVPLVLKTEH